MSLFRSCAAASVAIAVASAMAHAGTFFRLEVGPPTAAGIAKSKEIKNAKRVVFAVRPRLCDRMSAVAITGTAEGLVNGTRRSIPLDLIEIDPEEGVFAVMQQWPEEGSWVVQLNGTCPSPKASASTLVPVNKGTFIREKAEVLPATATRQQLEATLTALARSQS